MPPFWDDIATVGWLGLHLPEDVGGSGYGLAELAVVLEELGRACAPGPFLPTVLASAVIDRLGDDRQRAALLPELADGSLTGAVAFAPGPVLGGGLAGVIVVPVEDGWGVVRAAQATITPRTSVDVTRRVADVSFDAAAVERLNGGRGEGRSPQDLAITMLAAECSGGAAWCVETAAEYARVREQFGRPIGQFQAVKHRCADMLCALEQARAVAWDASRPASDDEAPLTASVAGTLVPDAFFRCAKDCIQVLGGIGFTWEHDAHLYLKRAAAIRALTGGGPHACRKQTFALARGGARRTLAVDLPPEADPIRAEVDAFLADVRTHDKSEWRALLADNGYIAPHWPAPWGRDAGPVEQLVIDAGLAAAHVRRPHLQVGAWVLPTLIAHGTAEQQERWVPQTLRGELKWCQLFSEPGAGSDLASLSTKASRVTRPDGTTGWSLSGQKVWTSMAKEADWGICLARTDPTVPKHEGITCFFVDMTSEGIDIRPLRELTGWAMFNEVFLSDVFVPDDCVVGDVDDGWKAARTTLANERVSMGSGSSFGLGVEMLLGSVDEGDPLVVDEIGGLLAEAQSLAVLGLRMTARALSGAEPGPESSVRKLLGVEHDQRVQEVGLGLLGTAGAANDGDAATWVNAFLANRCLTIAGGTSEVQRNVIAERLLGLPRD